ncbi:hypothetical protein K505DRAFT_389735 [Melanomma pulvis-pyrius CBS 109.77]|uniref:Uncharacterized protein n=1 Tax=Melanomma pulvis-pyrius CBS 109.77 TaxID=1314802 RepID=A0A6A6XSR4_9PLEO|nr:hypothetical protein K505DRAFT_389735 [Melanomma pulvis-pyrius CBS 109.77]
MTHSVLLLTQKNVSWTQRQSMGEEPILPKPFGAAYNPLVRVKNTAHKESYEDTPYLSTGGNPSQTTATAAWNTLRTQEDPNMHESKRRKIDSFFHHERTEALDPSLVCRTPSPEQANNILYAEGIGKQYQLNIKDHQIQVRDDRIRAKDKEIAGLEAKIELEESLLSFTMTRNQELNASAKAQACQIARLNQMNSAWQQDVQQANRTIRDQDVLLRNLYNELRLNKAELQDYRDQRFVDHLLKFLRGLLRRPDAPQDQRAVFPLMKLPGELRNLFYRHALVLRRPIDFWPMLPDDSAGMTRCTVIEEDLKQISGNLLRVSRQVHKETVGVLYGYNRFRFSHYGSWTILTGFLSHINTNCQFLTSISVKAPDCWTKKIGVLRPLREEQVMDMRDMRTILGKFGQINLDSPTSPPLCAFKAFAYGSDVLVGLPNLKNFTIVVPHNEEIYEPATMYIADILTPEDHHLTPGEKIASSPKRTFVFLRRPASGQQIVGSRNVDDDVAMGREKLALLGGNANIKSGSYGTREERVSYVVDGGEDDVEVPDYIEQPEVRGSFDFFPFRVVKKLLGY